MIDVTPANVAREYENAEGAMKARLASHDAILRALHGPAFKSDPLDGENAAPENVYFEWVSYSVPQKAGGKPRFRVESKRAGVEQMAVRALHHGLNRWARDSKLGALSLRLAVDHSVRWAVASVNRRARFSHLHTEDPLGWPTVERISPRRFGWDPCAIDPEEVRFWYHKYPVDRQALLKHARENKGEGWDADVIESLPGMDELEGSGRDKQHGSGLDRDEIWLADLWFPEYEIEPRNKGFNGGIVTHALGCGEGDLLDAKIRKDRGYFGPREGPYVLIGSLPLSDEIASLSPLVAAEAQIRELNAHASATSRSARSYKRLVLCDAGNRRLIADLKNKPHDFVFPVKGFQKDQVVVVELGGASQQMIDHLAIARDRVERNLGLSDVLKGNISGQATATEVAEASRGTEMRTGLDNDLFMSGISEIGRRVGYFLFHDNSVVLPLGPEAAEEFDMESPVLFGGSFELGSGATYDDLEVDVDAHTVRRPSQATQLETAMRAYDLVANLGPIVPELARYTDIHKMSQEIGDAMNAPWLPELWDLEAAEEARQERIDLETGQAGQGGPAKVRPSQSQPVISRAAGGSRGAPGQLAGGSVPKLGPRSPANAAPKASGRGGAGQSSKAAGAKKPQSAAKAGAK